jgi:hypothetical protein
MSGFTQVKMSAFNFRKEDLIDQKDIRLFIIVNTRWMGYKTINSNDFITLDSLYESNLFLSLIVLSLTIISCIRYANTEHIDI